MYTLTSGYMIHMCISIYRYLKMDLAAYLLDMSHVTLVRVMSHM